ncbi:MFS transporter [Brackiella oedipodis]|uniref:MFS transporter n=1 Tax=Brackiella oedipodis TaxID=124225 RepID=UPI00048C10E1|nr:MFS transporter [Brackiella oedipodis]
MALESNGYVFKPHEVPFMAGSPASPDHPQRRRLAYFLIGVFLAIYAGLINGFTLASLPLLQGVLGLSRTEGGWLQVSYYMVYACMSIYHFKLRQHMGLTPFIKTTLLMLMISNSLDILTHNYVIALISRGISALVANGLMLLGSFYMMQSFPGPKKPMGLLISIGMFQLGLPLARVLVPFMYIDGDMQAVYIMQFALAIISLALMIRLPLPPTITRKAFEWIDIFSLGSLIIGIALACAFWVLGPIVWWDTWWLGYLAAGSLLFTGICVVIERHRKRPMLYISWFATSDIIVFGLTAAVVRLLTSEQNVGAYGLLTSQGLTLFEMIGFNAVIVIFSTLGTLVGLFSVNLADIRRGVIFAMLIIAIASFIDVGQSTESRPNQFYLTQAMISFSALLFMLPMMFEGLIRALARGVEVIMSFSAIFGFSQIIGALAGNALSNTFIRYRTMAHFTESSAHLTAMDPQVALQLQQLHQAAQSQTLDPILQSYYAVSTMASEAQKDATVTAYNDLFMLMGILATLAFVFAASAWINRYYRNHNIIGDEIKAMLKMAQK